MNIYLINAGMHQEEPWCDPELRFDFVAAETRGKARALFVQAHRDYVNFTSPMRMCKCKVVTYPGYKIPEGIITDDELIPDYWWKMPQVKRVMAWSGEEEKAVAS